ncbi:PREDICTED: hematopoietic SH2 domain-containing protein isoform X2 [Chinchilla lanigera]|uniref:Hematopoietic SH2 domain containing n=1 Tax=Chinchilla lanigera TaxID=34839 RepID=A0A8C2UXA0_CHILA|nr:PREDICTED: hematopoietic SH2 domain-containing protein isoform X2 [Chinchilla lanigera]
MAEAERLPPPLPPRLDWFVHTQMGQLAQDGIPEWFHGAISRGDAESLLESQPPGSFLIRVSHSHVGYTLSYRVQGSCCHAMVMLLDDGCLVLRGEDSAHTSLGALVAFYQRRPLRPHGQLLTRGCGQKDPATTDYEDLLLCATTLAQDAAGPEPDPEEHRGPCWGLESPREAAPPHPPEDKEVSAERETEPVEQVASPQPPRGSLRGATQKLWQNLRALPATGRRVQQRLKGHLAAVSLAPLWPSAPTPNSRARVDSWGHRAPGDPHVATSPGNLPRSQARPRDARSRKATRPATWSGATSGNRGWCRKVTRALSAQPSEPRPGDWLPEEYQQPPPFAPGYC